MESNYGQAVEWLERADDPLYHSTFTTDQILQLAIAHALLAVADTVSAVAERNDERTR